MGTCRPLPSIVQAAILGLFAGFLLSLTGCVSSRPFAAVPHGSPPLLREGTHGVLVMWKGPPLWRIYTYFHIPGEGEAARFDRSIRCRDSRVEVRMGRGISDSDVLATEICHVATSALLFLDEKNEPGATGGLRIRMHVVPQETVAWRRTIYLSRTPRLSLAVPLLDDRAQTLALVAKVVAHEGSHIVDHVNGAPHPASFDAEKRAHRLALCAQLVVFGRLDTYGLPSPAYTEGDAPISRSTQAGSVVFGEAAPLLREGPVERSSPAADEIMSRCQSN